MRNIRTPLDSGVIRSLRVGDTITISGTLFTARDAAHEKLLRLNQSSQVPPIPWREWPCFHCGPVMKDPNGSWQLISAGPTTSSRMDVYEGEFIEKFGTKLFIGKGGMGENTSRAFREQGGAYAQFTGGAGSLVAEAVREVRDVYFLQELGVPEALWILEVEEFGPLLVTMDSQGSSLHRDLEEEVEERLRRMKDSL